MSYDLYLYHKTAMSSGEGDDRAPLVKEDAARIVEYLKSCGFETEDGGDEMIKEVPGGAIQVCIFPEEIAVSVPYWPEWQSIVEQVLHDLTNMPRLRAAALFDPQTGQWTEL